MSNILNKSMILALLAFAQLIIAIDYTIVFVAVPDVGRELGFAAHNLQRVVSGYAVVFGGFLLLGGHQLRHRLHRPADRQRRRSHDPGSRCQQHRPPPDHPPHRRRRPPDLRGGPDRPPHPNSCS